MDKNTFGSFTSAKNLVEELNLQPILIRTKVSRFLQDYKNGLSEIKRIKHITYKRRLSIMWKNEFLSAVNFDIKIDTFINNVIIGYHRDFMNKVNKE